LIPVDQWNVFHRGMDALAAADIPVLLGGAMAMATYTRHWRSTKDIDVIVRPAHRERAVAALRAAKFGDFYEREAYDRAWIFRGFTDGVLFDVFWQLPNHRVTIDEAWFERATPLRIQQKVYHAVPAEELIRIKLYVMQRERCDWVDALNVLAGAVESLDWEWLVSRMGRDLPLLQALLAVFNWMSPARARAIPGWVRERFALAEEQFENDDAAEERRVRLFDSRPWFAARLPEDRPLER
jgi:hypothetical protein